MEHPFIINKNNESLLSIEKDNGKVSLLIGESSRDASISLGGSTVSRNGNNGISVSGPIKAGEPTSSDEVVRLSELREEIKNSLGTSGFEIISSSSWDSSNEVEKVFQDLGSNDMIEFYPASFVDKINAEYADIFVNADGHKVTFKAATVPLSDIRFNYFIIKGDHNEHSGFARIK